MGWVKPGCRRGEKIPKGIASVRDLARREAALMQSSMRLRNSRVYLDQQPGVGRLSRKKIPGYDDIVSTHLEVGSRVLSGRCDVGLATATTAHLLGLDFVLLVRERFDMVVPKDRFFTAGIQRLLGVGRAIAR